jgi:hypothetical protein
MLKLRQEDAEGLIVWAVCEVVRGFPTGSWGKFTSRSVAENFMRWLRTLDTEGLIRRILTDRYSRADEQLYESILTRREHASRVDVEHITGTYWQMHNIYPHAAF